MEYKTEVYELISISTEELKTLLTEHVKEKTNIDVANWAFFMDEGSVFFERNAIKKKVYKEE